MIIKKQTVNNIYITISFILAIATTIFINIITFKYVSKEEMQQLGTLSYITLLLIINILGSLIFAQIYCIILHIISIQILRCFANSYIKESDFEFDISCNCYEDRDIDRDRDIIVYASPIEQLIIKK